MSERLLTKKFPELTRIRRGYWRNLWFDPSGRVYLRPAAPGITVVDPHHYYGRGRWPSAEIAEQKAVEAARVFHDGDKWVEAVFFPET